MVLGIGTSISTGEHMSEASKALARRLWDVWHSRDLDRLGDLIAEGHINHDPNNPADLVGVEGYRELITLYTTMFSDLRFEIHDIVAEGDIVCSRWTSVGTHDGKVLGITPTGNLLKRTGVSWQRIEHGKFVETWVERDGLGLARDIGAVPSE
jgi:predicted ester cyclase